MSIDSTEVIILMAVLILLGITLSFIAHRHQQRKEAKARAVKQILGETTLLSQLISTARAIPIPTALYTQLVKDLGKQAVHLRRIDAENLALKTIAETLVSAEKSQPPQEHVNFPPGKTLQDVQRDLKSLQSYLQKQSTHSLDTNTFNNWKTTLTELRLDVEREYFVRLSKTCGESGKKREAAHAINHAIKLASQAPHLDRAARQTEMERLKEIKKGLSEQKD